MVDKKEEEIVVPAKDYNEMKSQFEEMKNLIYGCDGKEPKLVMDIVSAIVKKMDSEDTKSKLSAIMILVIILIVLTLVVILLMIIYQNQFVDVTDIYKFLPVE